MGIVLFSYADTLIQWRSQVRNGSQEVGLCRSSISLAVIFFFTDEQVFLSTDLGGFFCEDTVFEHKDRNVSTWCANKIGSLGMGERFDWDYSYSSYVLQTDTERFLSLIQPYSQRQLSNQQDDLVAVSGVLETFRSCLGRIHYGTPWKIFDYTICWSSASNTISRRSPFPSWSWVGWEGPISFQMDLHPERNFRGGSAGGRAADDDTRWQGSTVIDKKKDDFQSLRHEYGIQVAPKAASLDVMSRYYQNLLGHKPRTSTLVPKDFFLHFTTSSRQLEIGCLVEGSRSSVETEENESPNCDVESPSQCNWQTSVIQNWRIQQPDDLKVEFIVVSAGGSMSLMPIKWESFCACEDCDTTHLVTRRIAQISIVEHIRIADWMSLEPKPQEKFIILG